MITSWHQDLDYCCDCHHHGWGKSPWQWFRNKNSAVVVIKRDKLLKTDSWCQVSFQGCHDTMKLSMEIPLHKGLCHWKRQTILMNLYWQDSCLSRANYHDNAKMTRDKNPGTVIILVGNDNIMMLSWHNKMSLSQNSQRMYDVGWHFWFCCIWDMW